MERILIVDDEPSIRKALSMGLTSDGFEVDTAQDGTGGILLGRQKEYDILIVDLCLPDMNGLDVIEKIKTTSPEIIPIIITGNGSLDSSLEAIRLEVSNYLEKPLNMESVKNSIERGLEKRRRKQKAFRKKLLEMLEVYKGRFPDNIKVQSKAQHIGSGQISETISTFVHQINNPLMAIFGGAELGMLQLDDVNAIKQYFSDIIRASEEIQTINEEIMKLHDPRKEHIESVDLNALIDECLQMFKNLMMLRGVSVDKDLDADPLTVSGNRFGFEQLFKNIILNAIDSMDDMPERMLKIGTKIDENASLGFVYIKDTGCGIPEESMDDIFKPYFTGKQHGTGLGLPVAKDIVERWGGNIAVDSEPGKGTTFAISLPIQN